MVTKLEKDLIHQDNFGLSIDLLYYIMFVHSIYILYYIMFVIHKHFWYLILLYLYLYIQLKGKRKEQTFIIFDDIVIHLIVAINQYFVDVIVQELDHILLIFLYSR